MALVTTAICGAAVAQSKPLPVGQATSPAVLRYRDLRSWYGLRVDGIQFEGVLAGDINGLVAKLPLHAGDKLSAENVKQSLHQMYASGLYRDIQAVAVEKDGRVTVIFRGVPQLFLRRLFVRGMKQDLLAAQIERATRLTVGEPFTTEELDQATANLKDALKRNGFYEPTVSVTTTPAGPHHLVDVIYTVNAGRQATVGAVTVAGDPGLTASQFRRIGKLKERSKVTSNTVPRALSRLRKHYQKHDRLEATVRAEEQTFRPASTQVDYRFSAHRGPLVRVVVTGAKISRRDVRRLVPVYEEGAVDPDLLDEGGDNLRNHFQKQGYFDTHVTHTIAQPQREEDVVTYRVKLGTLHKVAAVTVTGNRYFDRDIIKERLGVQRADTLNRHGLFSQSLLENDANAVRTLYKSNGFANVEVTPKVVDSDRVAGAVPGKLAVVRVTYAIHEGVQQRIGTVQMYGAEQLPETGLLAQMNTRPGEPYSLTTLAADRLQLFDYYYRHGFSQADLTFERHPSRSN
ncbi:MAG: POTRA domain-containing protein, partial [Acidobacteriaceae bacterium]